MVLETFLWIGKHVVSIAVGIYACRFVAIKSWRRFNEPQKLAGKTYVITGGNCGIGRALAEQIALNGGNVVIACRDKKASLELIRRIQERMKPKTAKMSFKHLNLDSFQSVQSAAAEVLQSEPKIDVLINNAGVMRSPYRMTEDGFENHMSVNHLGQALLTNLLLPRIASTGTNEEPSRIVFVTSSLYSRGSIRAADFEPGGISEHEFDLKKAYSNSKLASLMYAKELSTKARQKSLPITISFASPGMAFTSLNRHFRMPFWKIALLAPIAAIFVRTAHQASQTVLYAAASEKTAHSNGQYFRSMRQEELKKPATDLALQSEVYQMTIDAIKVDPFKNL